MTHKKTKYKRFYVCMELEACFLWKNVWEAKISLAFVCKVVQIEKEGGLGFKNLTCFNRALVEKQGGDFSSNLTHY